MFNIENLLQHVQNVSIDNESLADFEDWFRKQSRDAHLSKEDDLLQIVFAIEDVFSQIHFEDLPDVAARKELGKSILPLLPPHFAENSVSIGMVDHSRIGRGQTNAALRSSIANPVAA